MGRGSLATPLSSISSNCRQFCPSNPTYANLLKRHPVWDYSSKNMEAAKTMLGRDATQSVWASLHDGSHRKQGKPEIDVLFYGSLNPRRQAILEGLRAAGLKVVHLCGSYGEDRDAAIANAKVVLNMHYYEDSIHEVVRTSYLLANRKAVVSEAGPSTEIEDEIREAMVAVPYGRLIEACAALVKDEARRHQLEKSAFEIFARRSQARQLADAVARTSPPMPLVINLGSGNSWSPGALNVDIDPRRNPDLLADLSAQGWVGRYFMSSRFGLQRLGAGQFESIVARDVLEFVPDLPRLMATCLHCCAKVGGCASTCPTIFRMARGRIPDMCVPSTSVAGFTTRNGIGTWVGWNHDLTSNR